MSKENKENSTAAYIKPMIDVISMGQESLMAAVSGNAGGATEETLGQNAKQMGDDDSDLWDE